MLPEGWHRRPLGEVADILTGYAFSSEKYQSAESASDGIRLLRGDNVMQGRIDWEGAMRWPVASARGLERFQLREGDVVLALDRSVTKAGLKCAQIELNDLPCLLVQRVARIRAHDLLCQGYLWQVLTTKAFASHLVGSKTETAVPHVSPSDVRAFEVPLPSLVEQRRVGDLLAAWDQAIQVAARLHANLESQRSIVVGELMSGRRGLASADGRALKPISDLICESRIAGSGGHEARKLTVKLYGKGVISKADRRPGSESTRYYRRSAGQFIYSKLDFLNGAFGIIPQTLDGYESTLDLPAFDFVPGVDPRWFLNFVSRQEFYKGQLGLANGGRKARRVNPEDFLRVRIEVPSLDAQRAIADAIAVADTEANTARQQVALLRVEKAALMADLLTGKRRVDVSAEADATP